MKKLGKTLATGLLAVVAGCGDTDSIHFVQSNRPAKWYVLHQEIDQSTFFFDREGDGTIDEVLKLEGYARNSLGDLDMIPKHRVQYFIDAGTPRGQQCIDRVDPQPLSQTERDAASQLVRLFYNK